MHILGSSDILEKPSDQSDFPVPLKARDMSCSDLVMAAGDFRVEVSTAFQACLGVLGFFRYHQRKASAPCSPIDCFIASHVRFSVRPGQGYGSSGRGTYSFHALRSRTYLQPGSKFMISDSTSETGRPSRSTAAIIPAYSRALSGLLQRWISRRLKFSSRSVFRSGGIDWVIYTIFKLYLRSSRLFLTARSAYS